MKYRKVLFIDSEALYVGMRTLVTKCINNKTQVPNLPYHKKLLFDNILDGISVRLWDLRMYRFVHGVVDPVK